MFVRTARACTVASVLGVAALAAAEPAGNIDLNVFRPAMDSRGYLTINASQVLGDKELSFGLGSLDWGYHLLKLDANGNTYSIDNIISATLIGAYGIHAGPAELEFGVSVPFLIMSGDRGPDRGDNEFKLDGQGIGNIGLHFKTRFLKTSRGPHIGLGVIASLYLPSLSQTDRFLGEAKGSTTGTATGKFVPQIMGILDKEFGRTGALRVAINAGIRIRSTETFTNNDMGDNMAPVTNRSITAGTEIPYGLGIAYAIAKQRFDLVGEVFGAMPIGDHENYQPLEALGGVKLYLARNSFLSLGAGRGLLPDKGANPDFRALIGIVFEPNIGDRDGDGIKDDIDKCPDEPEDFDGFEDEDGCPDPDTDKDRIPDKDDKCPNEPETYNGFEDEDGCPDRGRVVVTDTSIEILDVIYFEYNKDIIKPASYPILDAVAATLKGNPSISQIEIQGHTDERGDDAYNLDLSDRRAKSVLKYLVDKGVEASRLTSTGYGETQPLDRRHNEAAWAKNRRVAFLILKRADN